MPAQINYNPISCLVFKTKFEVQNGHVERHLIEGAGFI